MSQREHRYSIEVSFHAGPYEADDMLQDIVDSIDYHGGDAEVAPYSNNPTAETCECCGADCWEDEMESCSTCGASICGGCMIHYDGNCLDCNEDDDPDPDD